MESLYQKIKYIALTFFVFVFLFGFFQQVNMFYQNTYAEGIYHNNEITILDSEGKPTELKFNAYYSNEPYQDKVVDVLYDKNKNIAVVIEWNHWLRNHLIVLMFVGLFFFLIRNDLKENKLVKKVDKKES